MTINEEEQSAWNLSQSLIMQIGETIRRASSKWINGHHRDSYFMWQEIKIFIWTDLNDKEKERLKNIEGSVAHMERKFKLAVREGAEDKIKPDLNSLRNKILGLIMSYRLAIMEMLGKYGYLIGRKLDSKRIT